jgi:Tol biopolymer transport system component
MRDFEKGDQYYLIDVNKNSYTCFGNDRLLTFGDGHPSFYNDKMVFDTYPDKSRMKKLYIYDYRSNKLSQIGNFYESLKYYGETRCDLHPRWAQHGKKIYFDSVHSGKRKLYLIHM